MEEKKNHTNKIGSPAAGVTKQLPGVLAVERAREWLSAWEKHFGTKLRSDDTPEVEGSQELYYLSWAIAANAKTRLLLPHGRANWTGDRNRNLPLASSVIHCASNRQLQRNIQSIDKYLDDIHRSKHSNDVREKNIGEREIMRDAWRGVHFKIGTCNEHASIAYSVLHDHGVVGMGLYVSDNEEENHNFVLLGSGDDLKKPDTKVLCDPWADLVGLVNVNTGAIDAVPIDGPLEVIHCVPYALKGGHKWTHPIYKNPHQQHLATELASWKIFDHFPPETGDVKNKTINKMLGLDSHHRLVLEKETTMYDRGRSFVYHVDDLTKTENQIRYADGL